MTDPFKVDGPTCISFSGGRTSGYMLWRVLQANGGLPDEAKVVFANTGKEMPETLDFVRDCGERWGVPITWIQRDDKDTDSIIDWYTANRTGGPYETLIRERNYLPNPVARFCTVELKILPMARYMASLGHDEWQVMVGYRADEPSRIAKLRANPSGGTKGVERVAPLAAAGVGKREVGEFWAAQPFDLALPNNNGTTMHGNCDLCFLKGPFQIMSLIRENPNRALWWMAQEGSISNAKITNGGVFRSDRPSYRQMHQMAISTGELFAFDDDGLQDCACTD
jgi:3'-phosphoadenosine 5'-phosphosulfate sulfotransferase (PAPS reductase)/FAD synthetase